MANITFRAKARNVRNADGSLAWQMVEVPALKRSHCDMPAFRQHPKFGFLANSDMFIPNVLTRIRHDTFQGRAWFKLSDIPAGVTVDASGFLVSVSFDV